MELVLAPHSVSTMHLLSSYNTSIQSRRNAMQYSIHVMLLLSVLIGTNCLHWSGRSTLFVSQYTVLYSWVGVYSIHTFVVDPVIQYSYWNELSYQYSYWNELSHIGVLTTLYSIQSEGTVRNLLLLTIWSRKMAEK